VVGLGGVAVEVLADRALALPPLNLTLAGTRSPARGSSRLLAGYRDRPPADLDALARILVAHGSLSPPIFPRSPNWTSIRCSATTPAPWRSTPALL
jgi:acetyltransferase